MATYLQFAKRHWFLAALAMVLLAGMTSSDRAAEWVSAFPRQLLVAAILFVTALPVDLRRMASTRGVIGAIGLAMLLNSVAAPVLGYVGSWLLPASLGVGLFAALASPCTMASAAVWTRRGGGNDAVALAVTLLTSLACFVTLPMWTWLLLGEQVDVPAASLAVTLLKCVAIPVAVAQAIRWLPAIAQRADGAKPQLSLAGQIGILGLVLIGAVNAGGELQNLSQPVGVAGWGSVLIAVLLIHGVLLLAGWRLALATGLDRPEAVAVAIAGSQKTLAVGVFIAAEFSPLAVLPMIAYHVVQLVLDTLFVDKMKGSMPDRAESSAE